MTYDLGPYNYDNEYKAADQTNSLNWTRLQDDDSFTDWTIIIKDGRDKASYYIHKVIVGLGPRYSEYFSKLFRSERVIESKRQTSIISLEPSASKAFPLMLDFIYKGELKPTTELSVAIRHLSNYFGVRECFIKANEFIQTDLSVDTVSVYWEEALIYNDEPLISAMTQMIAENFEKTDTAFLASLRQDRFSDIVASSHLTCTSEVLSARVADYFKGAMKITPDLVHSLTCPKKMPRISPERALFYVKLDEHYPCDHRNDDEGENASLLSRCAKAFIKSEETLAMLLGKNRSPRSNNRRGDNRSKPFPIEYYGLSRDARLKLLESALYHEKKENDGPEHFVTMLQKYNGSTVVMNAGVPSVNGVYTPNGTRNGCTMYTKPGVWKGQESMFALYRFDDNGEQGWYICFWPQWLVPIGEVDVYSCTSPKELPPMNNWETVEGTAPAPRIQYLEP